MLFRITGQPTNYFPVPVALMDGIIGLIDFFARWVWVGVGGWVNCRKELQIMYCTISI